MNLYAGTYKVNLFDQWDATLTRYNGLKNKQSGDITLTKVWELNENLLNMRNASPGSRNVVYWSGAVGGFVKMAYTGQSGAARATLHPLAETLGITNAVVAAMDASGLPAGALASYHPSRALVDWLYGYDVSYIDQINYARRAMLADQGHSGIVHAGPPAVIDSIDGFKQFAETQQSIANRVFVQTNDGILHVINPLAANSAVESTAIVPPPVLVPRRLFTLKATQPYPGVYKWIDVKDYNANTSLDIPISSRPAYLLDGSLQSRYFKIGTDWKNVLVGTLGYGGGGLYTMDITAPDSPRFYWYRETVENEDGTVTLLRLDGAKTGSTTSSGAVAVDPEVSTVTRNAAYWTALFANPNGYPYHQLGFNNPKPRFGIALPESGTTHVNIIALPGGTQNMLNINDNGKMGAALYLINPDIDKQKDFDNASGGVKVFNSASLNGVNTIWRVGAGVSGAAPYMGMMVSEPTLVSSKSSQYISDGVFAGDNRGNIFYVPFVDSDEHPLAADNWKIYTVGSLRLNSEASTSTSYANPYGVVAGSRISNPDEVWIAGGTADISTKGDGAGSPTLLENASQMFFSFILPDLAGTEGTSYRDGWTTVDASNSNSGMASGAKGWYMPLEAASGGVGPEYVTTRPEMFAGNVYAATFIPQAVDTNSGGSCASGYLTGVSRLYVVKMDSGKGAVEDNNGVFSKYFSIEGIKITGFTVSNIGDKKRLIVSYSILDAAKASSSLESVFSHHKGFSRLAGLDAFSTDMPGSGDSPIGIKPRGSVMDYWLMKQN
jgi:hypothetical protein